MRRDISQFLIQQPEPAPSMPDAAPSDAERLTALRALIDAGDASEDDTDFDIDAAILALEAELARL